MLEDGPCAGQVARASALPVCDHALQPVRQPGNVTERREEEVAAAAAAAAK